MYVAIIAVYEVRRIELLNHQSGRRYITQVDVRRRDYAEKRNGTQND